MSSETQTHEMSCQKSKKESIDMSLETKMSEEMGLSEELLTNYVELTGPQASINALKEFVKGETEFDFEKIVPMPKEFNFSTCRTAGMAFWALTGQQARCLARFLPIACWWTTELGISTRESVLQYLTNNCPKELELGKVMKLTAQKYGFADPKDWIRAYWGSNSNSFCDQGWKGNGIIFQTSANQPSAALRALSANFPEISMSLTYAWPLFDNAGFEVWKAGKLESFSDFNSLRCPEAVEILKRFGFEDWLETDDVTDEEGNLDRSNYVDTDRCWSILTSDMHLKYAQEQIALLTATKSEIEASPFLVVSKTG
jgi:hypothetical protein